ncbi:MAG: MotE family protein [Thermodesulfovibrionales bacterium]
MRYLFPIMLFLSLSLIITPFASSQDDILRLIEKKQKELKEREENLKKEEERLNLLKKELDEKIDRYSRLLTEVEGQLRKLKKARDERFEQIVKTFEAMPPEDAATRLNEMDEKTATKILSMMKPKKASAIMAVMEPKKVASLASGMLNGKKFPTR